jgi:hypothetical protein
LLARTKCRSLVSLGMTSSKTSSENKFPGRHRLTHRAKTNLYLLSMLSERLGGETKVKRRLVMYTGNLIDELISTVERAEKHAHKAADSQEAKLPYWYVATERERTFDSKLLGVA